MKRFGFGLVVILVKMAVALTCQAVDFSPVYRDITVGGEQRNFGYYVPESYDPSTPTPLLFMFHGAGGNNSEASGGSAENGYYGWQTSAHQNGFIVLFPKVENLWGYNLWSLNSNSEDLDFVDEMIAWAKANYNIRTSHIFTTGHSYGAYFSYCVARWRSNHITAFAEHSGGRQSIPVPTLASGPTPKLNGILLHAVDDGLVNYSGSQALYDDLLANGHNVYNDGIGDDGIIEVDGWGPDNHRYRKVHNQTQWDFFMASAATIDDDADGMPDSWETDYGLDTSANDASADNDGDGAGNYAEYIADTHPTNPASVFAIEIDLPTNMTVSWSSSSNRLYSLWYTTNLTDTISWAPVSQMTNIPGTGGIMVYTNLPTDLLRLFKASVSLAE